MLIVHSSFYDSDAIVAYELHFPLKVVLLPILIHGSFYNLPYSSKYVKIIVIVLMPGSWLTSCLLILSVSTTMTHVGKAQFMFMLKKVGPWKNLRPPPLFAI